MEVQERNWLDGPRLVEWLEDRSANLAKPVLGDHERAIRHWREGGACSVFQADRVLTKLNIHLHELPDHLWLEESPVVREYTQPVKEAAVRRVVIDEEPIKVVADSVGCSPRALRNWVDASVGVAA